MGFVTFVSFLNLVNDRKGKKKGSQIGICGFCVAMTLCYDYTTTL